MKALKKHRIQTSAQKNKPRRSTKGILYLSALLLFSTVAHAKSISVTYNDQTVELYQYEDQNFSRYLAFWAKNAKVRAQDVIFFVNMNLDRPFYTDVANTDLERFPVLVNKYNKLPDAYVPPDMVLMEGAHYLTKEATEAYKDLLKGLKLNIYISSSYRSYSVQQKLYNSYGSGADKFSAKPGYSEHQLGTAIDFRVKKYYYDYDDESGLYYNTGVLDKSGTLSSQNFEKTEDYKVLCEKAYEYGFILRYPAGKEHITGYMYEPWHWTYVGKEVAKACHDEDLTLEEYYVRKAKSLEEGKTKA